MHRLFFWIPLVLFFATFHFCSAIEWNNDYKCVKALSEQHKKPMLLFFNGSDWAGSAMKMKHEILSSPSFQNIIGERFVCMEVDFPKHSPLSEPIACQNQELKNRFNVQDLPSLLLVDAQERVIAQIGYLPESAESLASYLIEIVNQDAQLVNGLQHLDAPVSQLKELYELAQELGRQGAIEKILEAGLISEDPFFLLEKYRLLVEKGAMKSEEALGLRFKLNAIDQGSESFNGQGMPFTVALIDFQELSQKTSKPEIAAQPLLEYLSFFGKKDQKNVWRVEMMIAQLYLDANQKKEALIHAEKAYQAAPEAMHKEIAHSLEYIRSSMR